MSCYQNNSCLIKDYIIQKNTSERINYFHAYMNDIGEKNLGCLACSDIDLQFYGDPGAADATMIRNRVVSQK